MNDLQAFLYPRSRYYGEVKPQNLVFNANLQEFSQRVSLIANGCNQWQAFLRGSLQTN